MSNKTSPSKPVVDEEKDHGSPEIIPRIDGDSDREDLLELPDPNDAENLVRFQAHWQKSLPVVFSNCDSQIDCTLWSPDNFRDRIWTPQGRSCRLRQQQHSEVAADGKVLGELRRDVHFQGSVVFEFRFADSPDKGLDFAGRHESAVGSDAIDRAETNTAAERLHAPHGHLQSGFSPSRFLCEARLA